MVEIRRMNREAVAVLEVAGRLDVTTSSQLDDAINGVFDTNYRSLVIDCSGLKYVSSSGLSPHFQFDSDLSTFRRP